jgi:hypothetical protein
VILEKKMKKRTVSLVCLAMRCVGAAACAGVLAMPPAALAFDQNNPFEIDGNAVDNSGIPGDDWSSVLCSGTGTDLDPFVCSTSGPGPGGGAYANTGVIPDPVDSDTTHFKGGDKDTLDISAWDIVTQDDTPKDDIEDAYAAAYTDPDNSHLIIYAGDDRFAQAGDASHGFWFFKNKINVNGNKFTGVHADGDTLVAVEFRQGGTQAVINVFKWVSKPGPHQPNLQSISTGTANVTPGVPFCNQDNTVCGITNSTTTTSPWFYHSSSGDPLTDEDFPPQAFFELGIDITGLTGETCFASFLASSRSSASDTATIKDFVLHSFPLCGMEVGKSCKDSPTVIDGSKLETTFNVPIKSTGAGTIFNVTLAENPKLALGTGESCRITALPDSTDYVAHSDTLNKLPLALSGTTPVTVYDSIKGNKTATVTIVCDTVDRNPFINTVDVTAKTSASLSIADLTDSHTTGSGETCSLPGSADVTAAKCCDSVTIDPDTFAPKVCVSITVTNNSSPLEAIENLVVVDDKLGTVTPSGGDTLTASGAGASKTYSKCYFPTASDQTGDPLAADSITFTDHVTEISGTGAATGSIFDLNQTDIMSSATCNLCGDQSQACMTKQ